MSKHIFYQIKEAGIPYSSHETDLYVPVTPETIKLIENCDLKCKSMISIFIDNIDKKQWFDIPFAFLPAWEAKNKS